jgi:hypothetical protein
MLRCKCCGGLGRQRRVSLIGWRDALAQHQSFFRLVRIGLGGVRDRLGGVRDRLGGVLGSIGHLGLG